MADKLLRIAQAKIIQPFRRRAPGAGPLNVNYNEEYRNPSRRDEDHDTRKLRFPERMRLVQATVIPSPCLPSPSLPSSHLLLPACRTTSRRGRSSSREATSAPHARGAEMRPEPRAPPGRRALEPR